MNDLNTLKKILEVVIHADREFSISTALYKIKGLFDALMLEGVVTSDTEYGDLILTALEAKRVSKAMQHIIFARASLESAIEALQAKLDSEQAAQKELDKTAIESTCVDVTRHEKETQLQLENIPKKLGRPSTGKALTSAERSKRARDKKKANKLVTINQTLNAHSSALYKHLLSNGHDMNSILVIARNHFESYA